MSFSERSSSDAPKDRSNMSNMSNANNRSDVSNGTELKTVSLDALELVRATQPGSEMDVRVNFPFSPAFPAATGLELEGGHSVVYFEIDPGRELSTHADSPEELVVCLDGEAVDACGSGRRRGRSGRVTWW
jgi:hypothetical protein